MCLPAIDHSVLHRIVEWLDEYHPGSFRQAQVSFSTRIPSAFPLGDATTMSTNVCLYHTSGSQMQVAFRDVVRTAAAAVRSPPNGHIGSFIFLFLVGRRVEIWSKKTTGAGTCGWEDWCDFLLALFTIQVP